MKVLLMVMVRFQSKPRPGRSTERFHCDYCAVAKLNANRMRRLGAIHGTPQRSSCLDNAWPSDHKGVRGGTGRSGRNSSCRALQLARVVGTEGIRVIRYGETLE
jgi:hypothetical protein